MAGKPKHYDVIVIGSGAGAAIVDAALAEGLHVALVDKGPLGGTCLNVGCIPSKMVIEPADRVMELREARKLGVTAEITHIDFAGIMARTRQSVAASVAEIRAGMKLAQNLDFYEAEGHFVDEYVLEVAGQRIHGDKIFIASGARPLMPPVRGLQDIAYLTNDNIWALEKLPASLIILGGGYIAAEFAHFFSAMGSQVTILGRNDRLLPAEEPEISDLLQRKMSERMTVFTHMEALEARPADAGCTIIARDTHSGQRSEFSAERVLVAVGRKSNADLLQVEKAGIETDARGYIKVTPALETNKKNIWAFGDAIGRYMYRHMANEEAQLAWHNAFHGHQDMMDYTAVPHAVFTYPQVAAVGLGEAEARKYHDILIGVARYSDVAKGEAMLETDAFVKIIMEKKSNKILGCHIIGPQASVLIQEVIDIMALKGEAGHLFQGIHIHPALSEVILRAFGHLHEPQ